ncbi:MAG: P-II family nitrogen regulator [Planctomycetota bacterium]
MKRVIAIIKPFKLDNVVEGLRPLAASPIAVTEVRGYGRQKGHLELYGGAEYRITFLPKVRLELHVADEKMEEALQVLQTRAGTGRIGDGKVFILPVEAGWS